MNSTACLKYAFITAAIASVATFASPSAAAAQFKTLHKFHGGADAQHPDGDLTLLNGTLYGTANLGGTAGHGAIFAFDPTSMQETVLYSFLGGNDGAVPLDRLAPIGTILYGMTLYGGPDGSGTIFKVDTVTGSESVLYAFTSGADGGLPNGGLTEHRGELFGTTETGGTYDAGVIFKLNPQTGRETVLYNFTGGADGGYSRAGLTYVDGSFYGTTQLGGNSPNQAGTIFKFDVKSGTETVLYSFTGGLDGALPRSGPIYQHGSLYFTTPGGGSSNCSGGCGIVGKLDLATSTESVIYTFQASNDGSDPIAGPIFLQGSLYGTTYLGGAANQGTVFKINLKTGVETLLHSFAGNHGANPEAGLMSDSNSFYGATFASTNTNSGDGTIYEIKP